jgi:hypothetical protein
MSSPELAVFAHRDVLATVRRDCGVNGGSLLDYARAAVERGAIVGVCALLTHILLTPALSSGQPISASTSELSGACFAALLLVLVARSLSARAR